MSILRLPHQLRRKRQIRFSCPSYLQLQTIISMSFDSVGSENLAVALLLYEDEIRSLEGP
jgi:hypothetical protein